MQGCMDGCMYECKDGVQGCTHREEDEARLHARMHTQSKDGVCGCMKGAKMGRMDAHTCKDKVHTKEQRWVARMHAWG